MTDLLMNSLESLLLLTEDNLNKNEIYKLISNIILNDQNKTITKQSSIITISNNLKESASNIHDNNNLQDILCDIFWYLGTQVSHQTLILIVINIIRQIN